MRRIVSVSVNAEGRSKHRLLAPTGIPTPHQTPTGFAVQGGDFVLAGEANTGQMAALITPRDGKGVILSYRFADGGSGYPEPLFEYRPNRYTRAAEALVQDARRIADHAPDGHAAIEAIVNDVALKFDYGHPEVRFHDQTQEIPFLSCGLTEGSCVDINTYLIAMLRAAGFEAGYVVGYFFPSEKGGRCDDMHCWVATRHQGVTLEWDIAHHLKLGKREICCGLNPKSGERVAVGHSMGLDFPDPGVSGLKLLAEPVWIDHEGRIESADIQISMRETAKTALVAPDLYVV